MRSVDRCGSLARCQMPDSAAWNAIRATLENVAIEHPIGPGDREALRLRVCTAVDELKAMGWPIERIIIRLKELAREIGFARYSDSGRRDSLIDDTVKWCIEH